VVSDSLLFDASSLFFAAWFGFIAVLSLAAFGRDVFPVKTPVEVAEEPRAAELYGSGRSSSALARSGAAKGD
jgi:hypothetical protein